MWLNQKFYASELCSCAGAEALAQVSVARYSKPLRYVDGTTNIVFFVAEFKDINVVPHEYSI